MGEIYLARLEGAQGFEKLCVIKKILPHLSSDPEFVERFVNEAKTLVKLSHGSIAQVLDMGVESGDPYLALEHVDGKDLRRVAARMRDRSQPMPLTFVLYVMSRVLDALAYAHRKRDDDEHEIGLVHRDVSPQNVLISYEGEVKVIDFGLAKSTLNSAKTNPSIILGKFLYMSPEQARHQKVDRRSDLYSVGLCLYELIAGKNPFDDVPPGELMAKVATPTIAALQSIEPLCPSNVAAVVMKSLEPDPARRFQSAEEFRGKLLGCLLEIDPSAGPESVTRFMRDAFANEYTQERKLLASLREQMKAAATVTLSESVDAPKKQEVDTAVFNLRDLAPSAQAASALAEAPAGQAARRPSEQIQPTALSFAPTPRASEGPEPRVDGETMPGILIDLDTNPGKEVAALEVAKPAAAGQPRAAAAAAAGFGPPGRPPAAPVLGPPPKSVAAHRPGPAAAAPPAARPPGPVPMAAAAPVRGSAVGAPRGAPGGSGVRAAVPGPGPGTPMPSTGSGARAAAPGPVPAPPMQPSGSGARAAVPGPVPAAPVPAAGSGLRPAVGSPAAPVGSGIRAALRPAGLPAPAAAGAARPSAGPRPTLPEYEPAVVVQSDLDWAPPSSAAEQTPVRDNPGSTLDEPEPNEPIPSASQPHVVMGTLLGGATAHLEELPADAAEMVDPSGEYPVAAAEEVQTAAVEVADEGVAEAAAPVEAPLAEPDDLRHDTPGQVPETRTRPLPAFRGKPARDGAMPEPPEVVITRNVPRRRSVWLLVLPVLLLTLAAGGYFAYDLYKTGAFQLGEAPNGPKVPPPPRGGTTHSGADTAINPNAAPMNKLPDAVGPGFKLEDVPLEATPAAAPTPAAGLDAGPAATVPAPAAVKEAPAEEDLVADLKRPKKAPPAKKVPDSPGATAFKRARTAHDKLQARWGCEGAGQAVSMLCNRYDKLEATYEDLQANQGDFTDFIKKANKLADEMNTQLKKKDQ
jgi:serine/threonine-protein kinase